MRRTNILELLNDLAATSSKLDKISILEEEKNWVDLQLVLKATYDTQINYHIKKIPEYTRNRKYGHHDPPLPPTTEIPWWGVQFWVGWGS